VVMGLWLPTLLRATPLSVTAFARVSFSKRPSMARSLAKVTFDPGNLVQCTLEDRTVTGVVQDRRKGGWYTVELMSNDVIKLRSSQLQLLQGEVKSPGVKAFSGAISETIEPIELPAVPPPTIYDLDAIMTAEDPVRNKRDKQYIEHCRHHASYTKWVMFTDLHCATNTLDTCLEVLDFVHRRALERNAGILFLGDWWHHRGTLRVDLLNAVLDSLKSWEVPMVMIPGNHDQVTLGGHSHGLTPLQHAYRVEFEDKDCNIKSFPGPLIFSHPTKFAGAFFVPHIRDNTIMESILQSPEAKEASALFVHADVTGAYMNDLILSMGGVAPSTFPSNKPIYSGHFHKPHSVRSRNVVIDYIGSPYQTTMSEMQQTKALWVLDAAQGWVCTEKVPLDIGRKHFKAGNLSELLELIPIENGQEGVVRPGDRVAVTIGMEDLEEIRRQANNGDLSLFDRHVKELRRIGATVEVRELKATPLAAMQSEDKNQLEQMSPSTLVASFILSEVQRESMTNSTAEDMLRAALALIDEMETKDDANSIREGSGNFIDLVLDEVTLQGFGPFKDKVSYPLKNRGLVLVRGTNKDGGSDSNGTGKSTLAMAALWALTGSVDPRPMSDAKVADIVNDSASSARVSIRGTLNEKKFLISRTKTSTKSALVFSLDGVELTTQSAKETQQLIDENLGVSPQILARTMFHGQHSLNGLLEATDSKLKEELSLIVPTDLWQTGAKLARTKGLAAVRTISEFDGMIKVREGDLNSLRERLDTATRNAIQKRNKYNELTTKADNLCDETNDVKAEPLSVSGSLSELNNLVEVAAAEIQSIEKEIKQAETSRNLALAELQNEIDKMKTSVSATRNDLQISVRQVDRASMNLELVERTLLQVKKKWNLNTPNATDASFTAPNICPTCNQPLSTSGEGHTHVDIRKLIQEEMEGGMFAVREAEVTLEQEIHAKDRINATFKKQTEMLETLLAAFNDAEENFEKQIHALNGKLASYRSDMAEKTADLSKTALKLQQSSIEASLSAELKAVEAVEAICSGLQADFDDAESILSSLRKQSEVQRLFSARMDGLNALFGPRGIQIFVLQNAIEALQSISQSYLDELSDCTQRLEISLDDSDRILRRAFIRSSDGNFLERPLSSLSGGQWRRCSLSLTLGFADLLARRGKLRSSLLVLDEPLTHLDRSGRSRVGNLLRKLLQRNEMVDKFEPNGFTATTVLIILQDLAAEELEESFDRIDEVVKDGGFSSVSVDEIKS